MLNLLRTHQLNWVGPVPAPSESHWEMDWWEVALPAIVRQAYGPMPTLPHTLAARIARSSQGPPLAVYAPPFLEQQKSGCVLTIQLWEYQDGMPLWAGPGLVPALYRTNGFWRLTWQGFDPSVTHEHDLRSLNPYRTPRPTDPNNWLGWHEGEWRPVQWALRIPTVDQLGHWDRVRGGPPRWTWQTAPPDVPRTITFPGISLLETHRGCQPRGRAQPLPKAKPSEAQLQSMRNPEPSMLYQASLTTWLTREGRAPTAIEAPSFRPGAEVPQGPPPARCAAAPLH